jgi:predicted DNA repair protein MutK
MQKAVCLLLLIGFPAALAWAQVVPAAKIPAPVIQALQSRFPGVKRVEWKVAKDKNLEAEFTLKSIAITVKFDPAGKWLETETQISSAQVPKAVVDALTKRFEGYKIVETQSLQLYNEAHMTYEIHLDNNKEILKVLLAADGTIQSQSAKPKK